MMMRAANLAVAALLVASPLLAQDMANEAEREVDGGVFPAGMMARTDGDRPVDNVRVIEEMGTYQVDNGPAVVLWTADNMASGDYTVSAKFQQISSKGHVHGTGLVVGGSDLSGPDQSYTYFMVRGDGSFLVRTRTGAEAEYITPEWTKHEAVSADDAEGQYSNELAVQVMGDQMIFTVNGTEVYRHAKADLHADGLFGVRMNHNLTIRYSDLMVHGGM